MPIAIRTIGPLHIEDLEPHRFEDLVRQLLYDFRDWEAIEATGRSGGDDGFDVRAWERSGGIEALANSDDPQVGSEWPDVNRGRQWLVQCKREKAITPAKLEKYIADLPQGSLEQIHGLLFVAACDFSKTARDRFADAARAQGFSEARLWGRAELEDQLFQPKNDHLLFAYCGFSLQTRKRSVRTQVRSNLATKKALRAVWHPNSHVLLRDAADERYPFKDAETGDPLADRGRWKVFDARELRYDGASVCVQRFLAFIDSDGEHWDYAEGMNDARVGYGNPWKSGTDEDAATREKGFRQEAWKIWDELPQENKAWLEVLRVVPYDRIVAIDADGDEFCDSPHIYYVSPDGEPFAPYCLDFLSPASTYDQRQVEPSDATRVEVFSRRGKLPHNHW